MKLQNNINCEDDLKAESKDSDIDRVFVSACLGTTVKQPINIAAPLKHKMMFLKLSENNMHKNAELPLQNVGFLSES